VPLRRRRSPDQDQGEARARAILGRAVAELDRRDRSGITVIPVRDVLALLGAAPPPRDPHADPITGARWAGAPGSSPPEG
jgi:hypothetical protein